MTQYIILIISIFLIFLAIIAFIARYFWLRKTVQGNIRLLNKYNRQGTPLKKTLATIQRLQDLGDSSAVEPLIWHLENAYYSNLHIPIIEALTELGDKRAIPSLITFLRNEYRNSNVPVYNCIIEALKKLGATKKQLGDAYLAILEGPSIFSLKYAAYPLGDLNDNRAINPLIKQLGTRSGIENFEDFVNIIIKLGATKKEIADEYLKKLNETTSWETRINAMVILGDLGEKKAIRLLIDLFQYFSIHFVRDIQRDDEDIYDEFEFGILTLEKLGATKEQIIEAYHMAIKNKDRTTQRRAFEKLIEIHDKRAINLLIQLGLESNLFNNEYLFFEALEKLEATNEQIKEVALKGLDCNSRWARLVSIEKIIEIGDEKCIIKLNQLKKDVDDDVRNSAIKAIEILGQKKR